MYRLLRPLLFHLDAERAHGLGMGAVRLGSVAPSTVRALYGWTDERLAQDLWGLRFRAPLGLAAGFDKNARGIAVWDALGFGFAEVGSVTARPSAGNPMPRAFRLPRDRALVNRMGLNNEGAEAVAARLKTTPPPEGFVLAVNVAKTHDPSILGDMGVEDFRQSVEHLLSHAHVLVLNVSCPNTAEGKTFEDPEALDALLAAVFAERARQQSTVPVLVKLSPPPASGFDPVQTRETVSVCLTRDVAGFVATNTASDRSGLATSAETLDAIGRGGLSGVPLASRADALVRSLYRMTNGEIPIVGVGGIDSADAAYRRIRLGASLLEAYTGLVYEGPGLVREIHRGLVRLLDRDGLGSLTEAVGLDA